MSNASCSRFPHRLAMLAAAVGVMFMASSAAAQNYGDYGNPGRQNAAPETVPVYAPRFHPDSTALNGPLERVSLSVRVPFDDLDLRTHRGARELRWRVRVEAHEVCARLADAYPVWQANGTSCYKTALENALLRADETIREARDYRQYEE